MTTAVFYLKQATTGFYSDAALSYAANPKFDLLNWAAKIGVTAGSIVGAMAEENVSYIARAPIDWISDRYAQYDVDPDLFGYLTAVTNWGSPRTHSYWSAEYQAAKANGIIKDPSSADKIAHPIYFDIGHANFRIMTAFVLLDSPDLQTEVAALGLEIYKNNYAQLVEDLINPDSDAAAKFYGLMVKEAQHWFESPAHKAWGNDWANLPQEFKDALYVTYINLGPDKLQEKYDETISNNQPYEPMPGLTLAAGMNHLANAVRIGEAIGEPYGEYVFSIDDMAELKSVASANTADGLASRYALDKLNPVVLVGIDYE